MASGTGDTGIDTAEDTEHDVIEDDETLGVRMMKGIILGMAISIPAAVAVITAFLVVATGRGFVDSLVTSLLPSVLLGFFAGGFTGVVRSMH